MKFTDKKIYVIGGSPCSGKSTIAEYLSKEYNLHYFKIDDYLFEYLERASKRKYPNMYDYKQMTWNERWMAPVKKQVKDEFEIYREMFDMILEDIMLIDDNRDIITEGAALLPELIGELGISKNQVIYIVPTKEFQVEKYSEREFIKGILKECEDPKQAFSNWMERDYLFGQEVLNNAKKLGYRTIVTEVNTDINENIYKVINHFKF